MSHPDAILAALSDDPFEILGVNRSATDQDVAVAFRSLARKFHPDAHPDATPDEKSVYETAMGRINQAHDRIKDQGARERWLRDERLRSGSGSGSGRGPGSPGSTGARGPTGSQQGSGQPPSQFRPPGPGECELCGSAPAAAFTFHHQVGLIFASRRGTVEASLCRLCAQALGRSLQNQTLVSGWWGVFAFFTNFAVILGNAVQLHRAHRLAPPRPVANVVGRANGPMHPGKRVHQRGGIYVAAVVVGFVTFVGIGVASNQHSKPRSGFTLPSGASASSGGGSLTPPDLADWNEGNCVRGTISVYPVLCIAQHDGRIVAAVSNLSFCPPGVDTYVERSSTYYCIDGSR